MPDFNDKNRQNAYPEWNIGLLPFYVRCLENPSNDLIGLPDFLPFALQQDTNTGLIQQRPISATINALHKAYQIGSIVGGAMDDHGIGKMYAYDFLDYILQCLGANLVGQKVLEIGCGTGYLLSLLKDKGASVLGIEPGPQGKEGEKRFGVPVVRDFFPSSEINELFDVIVVYGVLEHITNPFDFLGDISPYLEKNGVIILAVPDCETYLLNGDVSCLLHEHWSYFTSNTLLNVLGLKGYLGTCSTAGFGGSLYGCFFKSNAATEMYPNRINLSSFREKNEVIIKTTQKILKEAWKQNHTVGIYVPARMINLLSLIQNYIDLDGSIRFFDDNSLINGKYYPGFAVVVENFQDLINNPVDILLIASNSFGQPIGQKVREQSPRTKIIQWSDLFEGNRINY